ncbi:MAG: iron ABC transporter permease [Bacteroidota bacterium]
MSQHQKIILLLLILTLPIAALVACGTGAASIAPKELISMLGHRLGWVSEPTFSASQAAIVSIIRLPRVLMSLLVGATLAICGTAMQGLFRNPLADPSLIGVSTGATLSAALAIVILGPMLTHAEAEWGVPLLPVVTFGGAVLSTFLIFGLASDRRGTNVATMLLAGIAINALAGAGVGLLTYLADDEQLRTLTFWTLGSLGGINWQSVVWMGGSLFIVLALLLPMSKYFNALTLGEQEAHYLGVPVEQLKQRVILATGLGIGCTVAFCGVIGFVGLVIPHLLRLVGGGQHRYLLPASALGGSLILCLSDTVSRTLVAPAELPIGIVTAIIGAPVFLLLLFQQNKRG